MEETRKRAISWTRRPMNKNKKETRSIKELQQMGRDLLSGNQALQTAALETDLLLCEILKKDRLYLMLNPDKTLDKSLIDKFYDLLGKRVLGHPIAYLIGHKAFMQYDFRVREGVLIPRDDTEVVISLTRDALKNMEEEAWQTKTKHLGEKSHRAFKGLEIGIGTGIISLILLSEFKNLHMTGVDINPIALANARENAKYLQEQLKEQTNQNFDIDKRFEIVESDLIKGLSLKEEELDFVVSNPPYIQSEVIKTLDKDVKDYEPLSALDGGTDGLDFYQKITRQTLPYIREGGFIAFEIGYDQGQSMINLMQEAGLLRIKLVQDLSGLDRGIIGFKQ